MKKAKRIRFLFLLFSTSFYCLIVIIFFIIDYIKNQKLLFSILSIFLFIIIFIPNILIILYSLKKEELTFKKIHYIEPLTGLPNRNKLLEDIKSSIFPTLFMINIDSFKEINDFYGYKCGDFVLKELANRILFLLVSDEFSLYKMESDEYAILLEKEITFGEIEVLGKYFNEAIIENPFIYNNEEIHITVTTGIASYNLEEKEESINNLLINSDMALKKAMNARETFAIFDNTLNISVEFENLLEWTKKLKSAIKEDRIIPYFQPIINNKTNKIDKYECLVRIKDHNKIITPSAFLSVAKKTKFYHKITQTIIKKSFDVFKNKKQEFSLNISVFDILDEQTNILIKTILNENKSMNKRVVFEILESEGIENYDEVKNFIDDIRKLNCKIAIDDFGSGYSNFYHLLKLNVHYIKIDASLIKNLCEDKNSRIIVRNINNFAKELGIKTIAEFVCNEKILKEIKKIGIDYSQGFYLGKPVPKP